MKRTIKVTRYIVEELTMELDLTAKEFKALTTHDLDEMIANEDERLITSTIDKVIPRVVFLHR
jgi:hypothetical protein